MKLRVRDRLLSALMGLVLVAGSAYALLYLTGLVVDWNGTACSFDRQTWQYWAAIGVCAVLILVGFNGIGLLFRRRKDKGVVVQRTEYGDMSISMKAMENMVRKCVDAHPELNVNHTRIYHSRGGVCVDIKITLLNGVNIPLTVNALQKQIKQYITSCSGVDVEEVRVMVETEAPKSLPAPEVVIVPAEAQPEVVVEKAAECICQHQEEPTVYAETTASAEETVENVDAIETVETAEEAIEIVEEVTAEPEAAEAAETEETVQVAEEAEA